MFRKNSELQLRFERTLNWTEALGNKAGFLKSITLASLAGLFGGLNYLF